MLATLKVRDLVLIEDVALDFVPGLNVLTGETGAGKSILLDALGLAAGNRAGGRSSVRGEASQGSAVAIFDLAATHPARGLVTGNGILGDGEIILRRVITADGRTRAFVNDEPVGVTLLRDLGAMMVEIHGQSDDRGLFDTATHRRLLDASGGHEALLAAVAGRFSDWDGARSDVEALRRAARSAAADADYLRHTVDELSALAPEKGEEERLAGERALLMNATRIVEDISAAVDALAGERGAETSLIGSLKRLGRMNEVARKAAAGAESALEQAFALTEEARRDLESLLSRIDVDAGELERKEERLFALRDAARKYTVPVDDLDQLLADCSAKLDSIDGGGAKLKSAEAAEAKARARYIEVAQTLTAARRAAAAKLESVVAAELVPLKLGHAQFRVAFEAFADDAGTTHGLERVAFEIATVAGAPFGPLTKIASGGELARISLALKVALAEASPPAALIFDEIDRGVGGAVADAVGERLQRVARTTQVLLVTHSPQVAARAARHFRISRKADRTRVELLSEEERIEEIARMLSGAAVTDEARAAARRLLAEAQGGPKNPSRRRA